MNICLKNHFDFCVRYECHEVVVLCDSRGPGPVNKSLNLICCPVLFEKEIRTLREKIQM